MEAIWKAVPFGVTCHWQRGGNGSSYSLMWRHQCNILPRLVKVCFFLFLSSLWFLTFSFSFCIVDCDSGCEFTILLTDDGAPPQVCYSCLSFNWRMWSPFSLFLSFHLPPPFLFAPLSPFSLSSPLFLSLSLTFSHFSLSVQEAHLDGEEGVVQLVVALQDEEEPTEVLYLREQPSLKEAMKTLGWVGKDENAAYLPWLKVSFFFLIYFSI